jgi:hypothetical protein
VSDSTAWLFAAMRDLGSQVKARDAKLAAVTALVDHAKRISPSDRMTVYVGDLEHALGRRTHRARTRTGSTDGGTA